MKEANNLDNLIMRRVPFGVTTQSRRRPHGAINFNDRSPEYRAMMAQLRSARYASNRSITAASKEPPGDGKGAGFRIQPFLQLRRSYEAQARKNFVRDVILFAVIVTISVWALIHAVRALPVP